MGTPRGQKVDQVFWVAMTQTGKEGRKKRRKEERKEYNRKRFGGGFLPSKDSSQFPPRAPAPPKLFFSNHGLRHEVEIRKAQVPRARGVELHGQLLEVEL